jgi:hypothetical protein
MIEGHPERVAFFLFGSSFAGRLTNDVVLNLWCDFHFPRLEIQHNRTNTKASKRFRSEAPVLTNSKRWLLPVD